MRLSSIKNKKILRMFSWRCFINKLPAMKCLNFLPGSCTTWCCMLRSEIFSSKQISFTGFDPETIDTIDLLDMVFLLKLFKLYLNSIKHIRNLMKCTHITLGAFC